MHNSNRIRNHLENVATCFQVIELITSDEKTSDKAVIIAVQCKNRLKQLDIALNKEFETDK